MTRKRLTAQKNGDRRGKMPGNRATQFKPGNPWRIRPGEVRNPGGRPKVLSESYKAWLEFEDDKGVTNAAKVAVALGTKAAAGDVTAAREMRQTTEGDKFIFDLTKLSDEQLERIANGEDPRVVLATPGAGGAGTPPAPADDPGSSA